MKTLSAPLLAAMAGPAVAIATLVQLDFAGTPVYLNTSTWNLAFDGHTYLGAYGLGQISAISDKPGEVTGITLELHGADAARISLALDDADIVQGTVCTLRTAIIDTATFTTVETFYTLEYSICSLDFNEDGLYLAVVYKHHPYCTLIRTGQWREFHLSFLEDGSSS